MILTLSDPINLIEFGFRFVLIDIYSVSDSDLNYLKISSFEPMFSPTCYDLIGQRKKTSTMQVR